MIRREEAIKCFKKRTLYKFSTFAFFRALLLRFRIRSMDSFGQLADRSALARYKSQSSSRSRRSTSTASASTPIEKGRREKNLAMHLFHNKKRKTLSINGRKEKHPVRRLKKSTVRVRKMDGVGDKGRRRSAGGRRLRPYRATKVRK